MFLTIQELELMKIIWELGEASVAQVKQRYQTHFDLAYTTIMTVLSRLVKKGMLKQRKSGRAFQYSAVYSREAVAEAALDNFARIFFNGSREAIAEFCRRDYSVPPLAGGPQETVPIDETLL
jgi:predicted transcriptional regulator